MVGINRGVVSDPSAPFGGVKQSGLGREGGRDGLHQFTETQYLAVDWPAAQAAPSRPPAAPPSRMVNRSGPGSVW